MLLLTRVIMVGWRLGAYLLLILPYFINGGGGLFMKLTLDEFSLSKFCMVPMEVLLEILNLT